MFDPEDRYWLNAWICEGGVVRDVQQDRTLTFSQVYLDRDWGCRYAVLMRPGERQFMVVDMFAVKRTLSIDVGVSGQFVPDEDTTKFVDTLEAAVMLAVMRDQ